MLTALLVGFQLIVTIFISIFARNDSSTSTITTYHPLYSNCAVLTLAFTLIYAPLRKLPLYSLASLLLTIGATVQSYLLLATFWDSCFQGFNSTFTVDTTLIVRCLFASLTVLLTALDFLGIFCYWQVYLIMSPIITFGSALTGAILIRGLKIFDGGGGLLVFLYSGVTSLVIWGMLIKDNIPPSVLTPRKSYLNHTLGLVGVTLLFINWPKYNAAGSLVSYINVDTASITTDILMNSAIVNTFLALSISTLLAFFFAEKESENDKMSFNTFSECIINVRPILCREESLSRPFRMSPWIQQRSSSSQEQPLCSLLSSRRKPKL
jgi:ammonia channel protein AmtB